MANIKGVRARGSSFLADVTIDGVRKTKTFKTLEDAVSFRSKYETAVKLGADVGAVLQETARGTMTLAEAYNATMEDYWLESKSEKTAIINATACLKHFGDNCRVADITDEKIKKFKLALLDTGVSATTVDRKLSGLSKMLATAVERGKLIKKPSFKKLLSKLSKKQNRRKAYLTEQQEREFLDRILVHAKVETNGKWAMFHDFVCFLIDTGARTYGEGLALPASDVQFAKSKKEMNSILFWETKTGEPRSVPMTPRVLQIMEARVPKAKNNRVWYLLTKDSCRHYWDVVRAEMGWEQDRDHCPYICRHTACSRLVIRGVSLPIVMQFMGHQNWETTLGYSHLAPQHLNVCAEALSHGDDYADDEKVVNLKTLTPSVA